MSNRRRMIGGSREALNYESMYLTFQAQEDATFQYAKRASAGNVYYSLNSGATWTQLAPGTATPTVNAGNVICWKASNVTPSTSSSGYGSFVFDATGEFIAYGNIMSMYYGDNFASSSTAYAYSFANLFRDSTNLISARNLKLPATTLGNYCYYGLFHGCSKLSAAPELPALSLSQYCYAYMFRDCVALTVAPDLPATTLNSRCYNYMFYGCSKLSKAPSELPALSLSSYCYYYMFYQCIRLTTAPDLPATSLNQGACYRRMFYGCTRLAHIKCLATSASGSNALTDWVNGVAASGTFIKASSATFWSTGTAGIPSGWTIQNA